MEQKTAKDYFNLGVITGFSPLRAPMSQSWYLVINGKEGKTWNLETARGDLKTFVTFDSVLCEVERITGNPAPVVKILVC